MNRLIPNSPLIYCSIRSLSVLCFFCLVIGTQSSHAQTRLDDSLTLVQFHQSTNGSTWTNVWNLNDPMDNWYGVFINYFAFPGGRVSCLDLDGTATCASSGSGGNNLTGTLNDLRLTECEYLYLSNNNLSGSIPNFSTLPNLVRMNLHGNNLTGTIPDFQNMPVLEDIRLEGNQLSGSIPDFSGVPNLDNLRLNGNNLTGAIPNFSNIPKLVDCFLHLNILSGPIPNFTNTPALQYLYVYSNELTGIVPNFSNLPQLIALRADNNLLTGSIPNFSNQPNLSTLNLNQNQLSGNIPDFANTPSLFTLQIHSNQLAGPIPNFSNTPNLHNLYANDNQLTGNLPDFAGAPFLVQLYLQNNQLTGTIPNYTNANLMNIVLHTNNLTGTIPDFNLPDLNQINFTNNNLTGAIPNFASLPSLFYLRIANNDLELTVPALTNISFLIDFDIAENKLTFEDLVSSAAANQALASGGYDYSNQDSIGIEQTITIVQGGSYTINLNIDNSINNSVYTWYKNGTLLTTTTVNNLSINNFQLPDEGNYYCLIDNPDAPLLTLKSRTTTLLLDNSCDLDLIATFPNCGSASGSIQSAVTNAPSAIYNWSTGATTPNLNNLAPGKYTLTVSDSSGSCNAVKSAIVSPVGEPVIEWQQSYGGALNENAESITYTTDGHILVSGRSFSSNGVVGQNKGMGDFWIIKTDKNGNLLGTNTWKRVLGGSDEEYALDHKETADGGVIIAGYTRSDDQDVTGFHGGFDSWVVKLSSTGTLEWQNALGGSNSEIATSIEQTADGGYIVGGWSNSSDGDVSQNAGNVDYWVVKLDASGGIEWQQSYGGSAEDNLTSIEIAPTGGYFIGGFTYSVDGDLQGINKGLADYWVVHIDTKGAIIWSQTYGGPFEDKLAELKVLPDGGLALIGWSNSNSGQITNNKGGEDVWFVKTDPSGNLQFENSLGTSHDDKGQYIISTDDHAYLITGYTDTTEFDVTGNHGDYDYWVAKLEHTGQLEWQKSLGGTSYEFGFACDVAEDGGYLVAGWTNSNDGDVSGNNGNEDFWVVKLNDDYPISVTTDHSNVSCNGRSDGVAWVVPQGGTPPYTYLWSNGQAQDTINNLTAGPYTVTAYDVNNCPITGNVNISQPPASSLQINLISDTECDASCTASASAIATGGTTPYFYLWDNGATSQVATALCPGLRYVTVTGAEGCLVGVDSVLISQPSGLSVNLSTVIPISCVGASDGGITAIVSGFNPPLTYLWNNGITTISNNGLPAGTYSFTATDANGCTETASHVLNDALPISVSLTPVSTSCVGGSDGSISSTPAGAPPYTYTWSNGAQTANLSNLPGGSYSLTITDNDGCLATASTVVLEGVGSMIATTQIIGKVCFDSIVVFDVTVSGGTAPYSYVWSNGTTTTVIEDLPVDTSGTYIVSITDNIGCEMVDFETVFFPEEIETSFFINDSVSCSGNLDGIATVTASSGLGSGDYTFIWDNGFSEYTSYTFLSTATGLSPGIHTVTVIDMFTDSCSTVVTFTMPSAGGITSNAYVSTPIFCNGGFGIVDVSTTGGLPPYTYLWSNGATTQAAVLVPASTYQVTVTDDDGCSDISNVVLTEPDLLVVAGSEQAPVTCNGLSDGQGVVDVIGGVPDSLTNDYFYFWDNGETTATATSLTAGVHTIAVTDGLGCNEIISVIINEPDTISIGFNLFNAVCDTIGSATILPAGGNGGYLFSLDGGTTTQSINVFSNLPSGNYVAWVTDSLGCTNTRPFTISNSGGVRIDSIEIDSALCGTSAGAITVFASQGSQIQYSIDGNSYQNPNVFTNLPSGNYTVYVLDIFGCGDTLATFIPSSQLPVVDSITQTNPVCQGSNGSFAVFVSGGTPPYEYSLDGANWQTNNAFTGLSQATYSVYFRDDSQCLDSTFVNLVDQNGPAIDSINIFHPHCQASDGTLGVFASGNGPIEYSLDGSNWQPQTFFTNLSEGIYSIYVRDVNLCSTSTTDTLIDLPGPNIDSVTFVEPICNSSNGTITIFGSGSPGPYEYKLDNGIFQSLSFFSGLTQGSYQVYIKDINNCEDSLTVVLPGTDTPSIDTIQKTNPNCGLSDGSLLIQATGGNPPYEFSVNNSPFQTDSTFNNLPAGSYTITVRDDLNCSVTTIENLVDNSGPSLDSVALFDPHCQDTDGTISLFASGNPPFEYSLDSINWQTQSFFPNLIEGTYTVYIRDVNQCLTISNQTLMDQAGPTIDSVTFVEPICNSMNGTITIFGSGSLGPYDYKLDNGNFQTLSFFSGLSQGLYQVFLRDRNGCIDSLNITLPGSDAPTIDNVQKTNPNCGQSDGSLLIQATGGLPPYEFSVNNSPFQTDSSFISLAAGNYTITVRDSLNCSVIMIDSLLDTSPPIIDSVNTISPICQGSNGSITIFSSGGTAPFEFSIDGVNYSPSNVFNNVAAGPYTVYVFDANSCGDSTTIIVTNLDGPTIDSLNTSNPVCQGSNGSITVFATGGTAPIEYSLDNSSYQPSNAFTGLSQGVYNIYVQDNNGCLDSTQTTLSELTGPTIDSVSMTPANCGNSDGSLTIHTTGGTLPLTYTINGAPQSVNLFNGPPGTYNIEVTDINGCSQTTTATIDNQPWTAVIDVTITGASCGQQNGSIVINAPVGVLYVYSIDNGVTTSPSNTFANLAPGPYHVWVANVAGCIVDSIVTLPTINPPVIDSLVITDAVCNLDNGEIMVYTSSGIPPMEYSIDNGATWQSSPIFDSLAAGGYTITVRDSTNCVISQTTSLINHPPPTFGLLQGVTPSNCGQADGRIVIITGIGGTLPFQFSIDSGMTFQISDTFPNLLAGTYNAVIKDLNGCEVHKPLTVTDKPGPVLQALNIQQPACNMASGSLDLSPTGSDFEYNLNGGSFTTNNAFNALVAGQHTFIIVNTLTNCSDTLVVTLTDQLAPDIGSLNVQQSSCGSSNGSISVSILNGLPPFTYTIDNGLNWQSSNVFNGLSANTYQIIVEDKNLCRDTSQLIVISNPGSPVIDSLTIAEPACNQNNGIVTVYATGGNPPLLYSLDGVNFQLSNIFTNLPPGPNTIFVFDATACQTDTIVTLNNLTGPNLDSIFIDHPDCSMNNGIIELFGSGGNPPYQYSIDNGATFSGSNQFTNLVASNYLVVIKDDRDCEVSGTAILQNQAGPQEDSIVVTPADCIANTGSLMIIASGGNPPYNYNWNTSPAQTGITATGLSPGQYVVTISDLNNCTSIATGIVPSPIPVQVNLGTDFAACAVLNQILDAGPGNAYIWSTGDTSQTILINSYGIYGVTLTDINNCETTDSIEIGEILFNPSITNDTTILVGDPIQLEAAGGLSYEWWPGFDLSCVLCPDPVATPVDSATYYVEISATNNCVDTLSVHVDLFNINNPTIEPPTVITNNGDGVNDVWVIPNIEFYPYNRVMIINRWGDVVYEAIPYNNDWDGSYKGNPLPQGTYYYFIELDVNRINTQQGSVTILR